MPRPFTVLLAALVLSYAAATGYTLFVNPEITFWKAAYREKVAWAEKLSEKGKKLVFVGGSSCAFQIDAGLLTREYDLPSVNMGMHAGTGAPGLLALGLSVLSPGDTLVLSMEPTLFTSPPDRTPLGYQMLVATGLIFRPGMHWLALDELRVGVRWTPKIGPVVKL